MIKISTKYAILIGINDYKEEKDSTISLKPLKGCVKDIQNIKKVLVEKCGFEEKNIYSIESSEENPQTEIWSRVDSFLDEIRKYFNKREDSIYFQFSGHGILNENIPYIMLHNSPLEVRKIPELIIEKLNPKVHFYTFDCCHCGESKYTRGEEQHKLDEYFKKSSGLYALYACKKNQVAIETEDGGKLTNTIIQVISDLKNYDEQKVLSAGALIERVKQKMSTEKQEPIGVIESTGYYPFSSESMWLKETSDIKGKNENKSLVEKKALEIDYNEIPNQRDKAIVIFFEIISKCLEDIYTKNKIKYSNGSFREFMIKKVYESLKWKPLKSGLEKKEIIMKNSWGFSIFGANDIKYEYSLKIDSQKKLIYYSFDGKFKNSFGIGFIVLPLRFGVSISIISVKRKFEEEEEIENNNYYFNSFSINEEEKESMYGFIAEKIEDIIKEQQELNKEYDENLLKEYNEFQNDIVKF